MRTKFLLPLTMATFAMMTPMAVSALAQPAAPATTMTAFAPVPPVVPPAAATGTILNISATERIQVPQDLLIATLRIEKTGADPKAVQNDVNTLMKAAVDKAKLVTTVKVSNGGYYIYEETPAPDKTNPKPKKSWRASQTIEIKGTAGDDVLKLTGELQDMGLLVGGLNYTLSPEKADEVKDSLMEAALAKVKTRAERAAKAMNKTKTDLVEINVDSSDNGMPRPMMMREMAMDAAASPKMATPTAEPGETEITLTVSAKAMLK